MARRIAAALILVIAVGVGGAVAEEPVRASIDDLAWIAGHWLGEMGSATIEEAWLGPAAGSMLGVNRTFVDGRRVGFEFLRLEEQDGGVVFLASPGGRHPATPFQLVELGEQRAVFANAEHDFPQRIIYRREADRLHGRIEGVEDGKPKAADWHWQLQP